MESCRGSISFNAASHSLEGSSKIDPDDLVIIQKTFRGFLNDTLNWQQIEFQVWEWSRPQLFGIYLGMAVKLGMVDSGDSLEAILSLSVDIIDMYLSNPYHFAGHAFDVAFMVYYMLDDLGIKLQLALTKSECISIFIAALGHDMGHPGLNNLYQVNSQTELSKRYNNKSVLENYSIDLLYDLLDKNPYLGLIFPDNKDEIRQIRELIKVLIINTDMAYHFENVTKLLNIVDSKHDSGSQSKLDKLEELAEEHSSAVDESFDFRESNNTQLSIPEYVRNSLNNGSTTSLADSCQSSSLEIIITDSLESRYLLISSILHAADISNPARPFLVSKVWSDKVMEELFLQGDKEKASGLPVSPSMDRDLTNEREVATGFTNFIVQPFFELLSIIFPRIDCFALLLRNNAQRREINSEPSPLQAMSQEFLSSSKSAITMNPKLNKDANMSRKVSLAAGMIEIKDDMISMSGRIMFNKQHRKTITEDFSRRGTSTAQSTLRNSIKE